MDQQRRAVVHRADGGAAGGVPRLVRSRRPPGDEGRPVRQFRAQRDRGLCAARSGVDHPDRRCDPAAVPLAGPGGGHAGGGAGAGGDLRRDRLVS
ncbi:hypothetical protein DKP78_18140, partial [Enterococcus faecium]